MRTYIWRFLKWLPFAMLVRQMRSCLRGCDTFTTWERKMNADWPTGFECHRCQAQTDLDGRFKRWNR